MNERPLPRRERQILDIVYKLDRASAQDVRDRLADNPSYSAVRAVLRGMEEKGLLTHRRDGARYLFSACVPKKRARRSALEHLVNTFFDGSTGDAVAALLDAKSAALNEEELKRLADMIKKAKKEGA